MISYCVKKHFLKMNLGCAPLCALLFLFVAYASAVNQPPVAHAGNDTALILGADYNNLRGTATDDSLDIYSLIYKWTQTSGPTPGSAIAAPDSRTTRVTFSTTGVYVFLFEVSDGNLTGKDTIIITVVKNTPLRILTPDTGAVLQNGTTYTITWEIYPVPDPLKLDYSPDGGKNWIEITNTPVGKGIMRYDWQIPADLAPKNTYSLRIFDYNRTLGYMAYSGTFSIVSTSIIKSQKISFSAMALGAVQNFSIDGRSISQEKALCNASIMVHQTKNSTHNRNSLTVTIP